MKKKSLKDLDTGPAHDKGFELEIKDPTNGEGMGMFITVTGKEGAAYRSHLERMVDRRLAAEYLGQKDDVPTVAKMLAEAIEMCAACTLSWRNMVWDEAAGPLEMTPENMHFLYGKMFIREQVVTAIEANENFIRG